MTTRIIEAFECTCDKCNYTWSSIKLPSTCANKTCRSPRWNKPPIGSLAAPQEDLVVEKKSAEASPNIERSYSERAQLTLEHPEHPLNEEPWVARIPTDYIRHQMTGEEPPKTGPHAGRTKEEILATVESLKPLVDKENYKKESVIPPWNPHPGRTNAVADQPDYYDSEGYINI